MKGIWKIRIFNIDFEPSVFDAWLPSGGIISKETYFFEATPDITVTNPGNTQNLLTITAYNQYNDSIIIDSSRSFSVSGVTVPDLAAPGYQVTCPLSGNRYGSSCCTCIRYHCYDDGMDDHPRKLYNYYGSGCESSSDKRE